RRIALNSAGGPIMALGNCRHCGAGRIPTDAPLCRECGGWRPNPGFFTRMGVVTKRLVCSVFLVLLLALAAFLIILAPARPDAMGALVSPIPVVGGIFGSGSVLLRSLIWPYGREVSVH